MTTVKTDLEIAHMRKSGQMLAIVLKLLKTKAEPGISTKELADIAANELKNLGGKPAFLGYHGFPDVLCTSINDEIVHGIPRSDRKLSPGDIVGLDFGVNYNGMITDAAISVIVSSSSDQLLNDLLRTTEQALLSGISVIKNGISVGDISYAIQTVLDRGRFGIVRDLVGHGVGHQLHEDPNIANFGKKGSGPKLVTGMTIAIEPMATLGGYDVFIDKDDWTVKTQDRSLAAHFEHTVLISDDGAEILTAL